MLHFHRVRRLIELPSPTRFAELGARPRSNPTLDTAAWAKLTAHMSHELRTPLNAVLGFSEMMSNEVFGPLGSSCYSAYARDIHASGRLLLKSAEDALAITALLTAPDRKGPPQISRLRAVSEDACAFAQCDLAMQSICDRLGHRGGHRRYRRCTDDAADADQSHRRGIAECAQRRCACHKGGLHNGVRQALDLRRAR